MDLETLTAFEAVSGLDQQTIQQQCQQILLPDFVIYEYYLHYSDFPSEEQVDVIHDLGLRNYVAIRNSGILF